MTIIPGPLICPGASGFADRGAIERGEQTSGQGVSAAPGWGRTQRKRLVQEIGARGSKELRAFIKKAFWGTRKVFLRCCKPPFAAREKFSPEGFQRASGKPFGRLRRGEISCETEKESKALSFANYKQSIFCGNFRSSAREGPRRFPKGERKALWSPPQRRTPLRNRKKKVKLFPLPVTRNLFLVRGFVRLRADEVLSHTGKYPKGAGGGQRVHVSWPPPDPPLLRNSAPLASQGRAQLGSRPSLGGPLSPSAQLIPPPALGRRSILGVSARGRHGRATLPQYVPRHQGHARCVPALVSDWLLAQGQTRWRARYGPCRSRHKGKCPFRYKGGPGVSLGRLKGV